LAGLEAVAGGDAVSEADQERRFSSHQAGRQNQGQND
jgi:hypothetical protein